MQRFSVVVIGGYFLQDFQTLEKWECLKNAGVNELDWEGGHLIYPAGGRRSVPIGSLKGATDSFPAWAKPESF